MKTNQTKHFTNQLLKTLEHEKENTQNLGKITSNKKIIYDEYSQHF